MVREEYMRIKLLLFMLLVLLSMILFAEAPEIVVLYYPQNEMTGVFYQNPFLWRRNEKGGTPTHFQLLVSINENLTEPDLDETIQNTEESYFYYYSAHKDLKTNTKFYWSVKAINDDGASEFAPIWSFTTCKMLPASVTLITPEQGAINVSPYPTLRWSKNDGGPVTSYQILISEYANPLPPNAILNTSVDSSALIYVLERPLIQNTKYFWKIIPTNESGTNLNCLVFSFTTRNETSINDDTSLNITENLVQNFPNPFNPETTIQFEVQNTEFGIYPSKSSSKAFQRVTIDIFNIKGQRVRTLVNDEFEHGKHSVVWNGTDDKGDSVNSGIYFYRMNSAGFSVTKKMMMIK